LTTEREGGRRLTFSIIYSTFNIRGSKMLSNELKKKLDGVSKCSVKGDHKVRNLFKIMVNNFEIWDLAHSKIASNKGATTKGIDDVTVDGHSGERSIEIMNQLRNGSYRVKPVRRVYIPKPNGKQRPLGLPAYHDKLVQEVCRILLEAVFEPTFSSNSYGFRPRKSCHDALTTIHKTWTGTKWFIEFDIKGYFDNINHERLMTILSERIDDDRFLALIRKILKAGYVEDWVYHKTYSGTPQGGVISPILSNIYLDKLDQYVAHKCQFINRGKERRSTAAYHSKAGKVARIRRKLRKTEDYPEGTPERDELISQLKAAQKILVKEPRGMSDDPNFRRLKYCRYADDFVLGFIGSKEEAGKIMEEITNFLKEDLFLETSDEKTKIEHHEKGVRFLGYDIRTWGTEYVKKVIVNGVTGYSRRGTAQVHLWVPFERAKTFCDKSGYGNYVTRKATHKNQLLHMSDVEIAYSYNAELRGICQYYKLAANYSEAMWRIHDIAQLSLLRTLASKYKSTSRKMTKKYMIKSTKWKDQRLGFRNEVRGTELMKPSDISRSGKSESPNSVDSVSHFYGGKNELLNRKKEETCEYCGTKTAFVEEHHIRALKDIRKGATRWERLMISRNRKTLILCVPCHDLLHAGKLPDRRMTIN
jgi:group II intron reverse transcriptase/maturase